MNKNINDGKYVNSLLYKSRLLFIFLFCLVQNTKGQIHLSEGTSLYSDKEIRSSLSDSLVSNHQDSKIYISSGVVISNNDLHRNYEIQEIISSEKKKINSAQQLALKTTETKLKVTVENKKVSVADPPVASKTEFSTQKSEFSFGFSSGLSKIIFSSQFHLKPILGSEHQQASLAFTECKLALVYFKNAIILKSQKSLDIRFGRHLSWFKYLLFTNYSCLSLS